MTVALSPALVGSFDAAAPKRAMRTLAGGVSVITVGSGGDRTGATVASRIHADGRYGRLAG